METTDLNLFVRTSEENISDWDRSKITDALIRETLIDRDTASEISKEVENMMRKSGIQVITAPHVVWIYSYHTICSGGWVYYQGWWARDVIVSFLSNTQIVDHILIKGVSWKQQI